MTTVPLTRPRARKWLGRHGAVPLLRERQRRLAQLAAAASAALVGGLAVHYSGHDAAGPLDTAVDRRVIFHLADHPGLLNRLTFLGSPEAVAVATLVFATVTAALRPGRAVWFSVLTPPLAGGVTELILKPLVHRTKGVALAFPSGHTTGAFALALVAAVLLLQPATLPLPWPVRATLGSLGLVLAGGTAVALVGLSWHYATDVVGGVGVALFVVLGMALAIDAVADRLSVRS